MPCMDYLLDPLCASGAVAVLLLVAALTYAGASGLFRYIDVWVGVPPLGDCVMMYKYYTGSYDSISTAAHKVHELAPNCDVINLCYDDPDQVPAEKLRWTCGVIICRASQTPDPDMVDLLQSRGYKEFPLPAVQQAVVSTFPMVTTMSMILSVIRVFGKMNRFCKKKDLESEIEVCLTVYGSSANTFIWPLIDQKNYMVHECTDVDN